MKQKFTRSVLALSLAVAIALAVTPLTAYAAPSIEKADAMELKAGQSDTFTGYDDRGSYWYKFELKSASKVVITFSLQNPKLNEGANLAVYHGIDGYRETDIGSQQYCYVSAPGGALPDYDLHIDVASPENNGIPSKTGTFYLAEGWHYIKVSHHLSFDNPARITVGIDSIEPIANTGGLTMQTATTVDPAREIIKQYCYDRQDGMHDYYWKFTLAENATVSITKSVKFVPCNEYDSVGNKVRINASSNLRLFAPDPSYDNNEGNAIWWEADGESDALLTIHEMDATLTRTITYELEKGTYYVKLHNYWATRGNEYTLSFSMPTGTPTPGTVPDLDSASDWAKDGLNTAISARLVPGNLQSSYKQATTRAEFAALAVTLYEMFNGEITERETFSDTSDINVQKAAAIGVVNGVGNNNFAPNSGLTREQAATMLARLANAIGKPIPLSAPTFSDKAAISSWASEAVGQMQSTGIMGGVGDNLFSPTGSYTREQSIVTILRLYEYLQSN